MIHVVDVAVHLLQQVLVDLRFLDVLRGEERGESKC